MSRLLLALGFVFALVACAEPAPGPVAPDAATADAAITKSATVAEVVHRSLFAMGTQMTISAYTRDPEAAVSAFARAFAEIQRLEGLLTTWRPDSDVSRINEAAGAAAVAVAPETFEVITRALEGSRLTSGKFDITFGALSGLWKFDHDQDNVVPSAREVKKRLPLVGWENVAVDAEARTVKLAKKGMKIHLGGIGKGYAVDRAVAELRRRGLTDFMVQFGGDMFVSGRRGERPWRVGIRDPRGGPETYFAAAEVTDATFSTSGDYERFFIKDGKRYAHILDPDTGAPAAACRSVTIMAADATTAEVLSKGVFILGPERGLALVESTPGAGAVVVDRDNQIHVSARLQGKVKILYAPSAAL